MICIKSIRLWLFLFSNKNQISMDSIRFQYPICHFLFVCLLNLPLFFPQLSCCGIQSYTNWSTSPYFFKHGIPTSCCMNSSDCNTQDLRNMTVAATKVNQKVLETLCQRKMLWRHLVCQWSAWLLVMAFHFTWLLIRMRIGVERW